MIAAIKACNDRHRDIIISQLRTREFMKPTELPKVINILVASTEDFFDAINEVLAEGGCTMCASDHLTVRALAGFTFGSALVCDLCGRTLVELKPADVDSKE